MFNESAWTLPNLRTLVFQLARFTQMASLDRPQSTNTERPSRFRFGLRSLLLLVGLLCVVLATIKVVSWLSLVMGLLVVLCIAAHVFGNSLGTKLREQSRSSDDDASHDPARGSADRVTVTFAPPTGLSQRKPLGVVVIVVVALGMIGGAASGVWLLGMALEERATWANMSLGTAAFAVLGGFSGFAISTFLKVVVGANLEAWRDSKVAPARPPSIAADANVERPLVSHEADGRATM